MTQLSDKEKAFVERAQREARSVHVDKALGWDDAALGAESAFPATVIGWDNPAAENTDTGAGDKWAYVAAMIESERAQAHSERARRRRMALSVTSVIALIVLIAGLQAFLV